jgi:hypothetical protein
VGTSLDEFKGLLREYRWMSGWAVGGALVAPFAASLLHISPPWPEGIVVITAIVELAILMLVFHLFGRTTKRSATLAMLGASLILVIAGTFYLHDASSFTIDAPNETRLVIGDECTRDAISVYGDRCPALGFRELREAEFRTEILWTRESISRVRLRLVIGWLVSFAALAVLVGAFLIFHSRARRRRRVAARNSAA